MKTFEIYYEFTMGGAAEVEADSLSEAIEKFTNPEPGEAGLPDITYDDDLLPEIAYDERIVLKNCYELNPLTGE